MPRLYFQLNTPETILVIMRGKTFLKVSASGPGENTGFRQPYFYLESMANFSVFIAKTQYLMLILGK